MRIKSTKHWLPTKWGFEPGKKWLELRSTKHGDASKTMGRNQDLEEASVYNMDMVLQWSEGCDFQAIRAMPRWCFANAGNVPLISKDGILYPLSPLDPIL